MRLEELGKDITAANWNIILPTLIRLIISKEEFCGKTHDLLNKLLEELRECQKLAEEISEGRYSPGSDLFHVILEGLREKYLIPDVRTRYQKMIEIVSAALVSFEKVSSGGEVDGMDLKNLNDLDELIGLATSLRARRC